MRTLAIFRLLQKTLRQVFWNCHLENLGAGDRFRFRPEVSQDILKNTVNGKISGIADTNVPFIGPRNK